MKKIKIVALLLSILLCLSVFAACGEGIAGPAGAQGDKGEQGIQGEKGDKGDQGEQGIQGEKGDKGDQGEQGIQGEKGDKGEQGIQGDKGEQGIQGGKGDTGATIEKVQFDDQGRLVITLTDGTVLDPVDLPEAEEHEHTFGQLMAFGNNDGLTCDKKMYCKVCSECFEVTFISGTKASHNYSSTYAFDKNYHWYDCANCSMVKGKAAHSIDDSGMCTVCNNQITASRGVEYAISSDGTYAVVTGYTASAVNVVISEEYEGVPVTRIGERAFENKPIQSVSIPATITSVGSHAFYGCNSLNSVHIRDLAAWCVISYEGDGAVPGGFYANPLYWAENLYLNGVLVTDLVIPDNVTIISSHAFAGCSAKSVTISDGVESIYGYAFMGCQKLTSIIIPESVTNIDVEAFMSSWNLTSIKYRGTEDQWNAIWKGYDWINSNYIVTYNYTDN